ARERRARPRVVRHFDPLGRAAGPGGTHGERVRRPQEAPRVRRESAKSEARGAPLLWVRQGSKRLALAELEATTRASAAVLLALDGARVAGEIAGVLEGRAGLGVDLEDRAGDAEADRAGLTGQTAAPAGAPHVVLLAAIGSDQRLLDELEIGRTTEVAVGLAAVDLDLALAGEQPHALY